METFSEVAIEIIDDLHAERLDYTSEYLPLINAAQSLAEYEDTGLMPEEIADLKKRLSRYEQAEEEGRLVVLPCKGWKEAVSVLQQYLSMGDYHG